MKNLLLIPGSIQSKSLNRKLCRYIKENYHNENTNIEIFELLDIPFFSEDLEGDLPESVKALIEAVDKADYVCISTPEYNNMIPGVLKNACEWLSRGYSKKAVANKPLGIIGASSGGFGTVRAQNQLILLGSILGFQVDASLRLPISHANTIFDETEMINDQNIIKNINKLLDSLVGKAVEATA